MYQIKLTPTAAKIFNSLHPDTKKQLKTALKRLSKEPYLGKALHNELSDFRSLKMKRYRAIYFPEDSTQSVIVVAIGHRRDIYDIAARITGRQ